MSNASREVARGSPAGAADAGAVSRICARAGSAVLGVCVSRFCLAAGLGIAFRNRPAEVLKIAAVLRNWRSRCGGRSCSTCSSCRLPRRKKRCAPGRWRCWPSRVRAARSSIATTTRIPRDAPRGCWRIARSRRAAGRVDPVASSDQLLREPGSRYIDFLIPGLAGHEPDGQRDLGMGFAIVDARRKKLMKRLMATPMPRPYYLLSFVLSRMVLLVVEVGVLVGFGVLVFHVPLRGSRWDLSRFCVCWARFRSARWGC